jgi:hypothetical protein
MRRQSFHLLLALLLLISQHAWVAHLASHAAAQVTHQQDGKSDSFKGTVKQCQQCLLFASLGNRPPVAALALDILAAIFVVFHFLLNAFECQAIAAYRSRAPPAFLLTW